MCFIENFTGVCTNKEEFWTKGVDIKIRNMRTEWRKDKQMAWYLNAMRAIGCRFSDCSHVFIEIVSVVLGNQYHIDFSQIIQIMLALNIRLYRFLFFYVIIIFGTRHQITTRTHKNERISAFFVLCIIYFTPLSSNELGGMFPVLCTRKVLRLFRGDTHIRRAWFCIRSEKVGSDVPRSVHNWLVNVHKYPLFALDCCCRRRRSVKMTIGCAWSMAWSTRGRIYHVPLIPTGESS